MQALSLIHISDGRVDYFAAPGMPWEVLAVLAPFTMAVCKALTASMPSRSRAVSYTHLKHELGR